MPTSADTTFQSWGRLRNVKRRSMAFDAYKLGKDEYLPFGNGRSYGDSCHNDHGVLIDNRRNDAILSFDRETGVLRAQSGILLVQILNFLSDSEWFLPVLPGTKFVTLGGAIANDIHGKNHERRGTFGTHVINLTLWRSTGQEIHCDSTTNKELFAASIAGMGLTGMITSAEIQLMKVPSHFVAQKTHPFSCLEEYFDLMQEKQDQHEYNVSWVDSLADGKTFGRGILITGDHVPHERRPHYRSSKIAVPFASPVPLVAGLPLKAFNSAYFWKNSRTKNTIICDPNSFFFPLDAVDGWNKLYGPRGLYQHQCVLPAACARDVVRDLLETSQRSRHGSFLTVLKRFGSARSPGLLSFPKAGFTLTLDFPNKGQKTVELLNRLDEITLKAGGRTNPYKDARMAAATFQRGFPNWQEMQKWKDPAFCSDFWRRTTSRKIVDSAPLLDAMPSDTVNQLNKDEIQNSELLSSQSTIFGQVRGAK